MRMSPSVTYKEILRIQQDQLETCCVGLTEQFQKELRRRISIVTSPCPEHLTETTPCDIEEIHHCIPRGQSIDNIFHDMQHEFQCSQKFMVFSGDRWRKYRTNPLTNQKKSDTLAS